MRVPARVQRAGGQSYYFDGVNPMILLGGGIGAILAESTDFDVPLVTLSASDFDDLQEYLLNKKAALDALAACAVCPTESSELSTEAAEMASALAGGG